MSYILDALRKAERERNLGQPPSMQAVTQPSALRQPPRRLLVPLLAGVTLLLLITMALLVWRHHRAASAPAPVVAAAVPAAPAAAVAMPPPADAGDTVSSFDDLAAPEEAPSVGEEPAAAPAPAAAAPRAEPSPPPAPEEEEDAVEEADSLPLLRDMPAGYRAGFPAITVEVHVYDDNPAKRWVMVNTRRYHEGEALSEGPRLVEITPDGMVFEHQGQRALYPIAR